MQAVSELDKEKSVTADPPQVFAEKYEPYIFPQVGLVITEYTLLA